MMLLTKALKEKLLANGQDRAHNRLKSRDHAPVVKFFNPMGGQTWLLSELEEDGDTLFGLCDLGFGCPELGSVSLQELSGIRVMGLGIERDLSFKGDRPMSAYSGDARAAGRIVT